MTERKRETGEYVTDVPYTRHFAHQLAPRCSGSWRR